MFAKVSCSEEKKEITKEEEIGFYLACFDTNWL